MGSNNQPGEELLFKAGVVIRDIALDQCYKHSLTILYFQNDPYSTQLLTAWDSVRQGRRAYRGRDWHRPSNRQAAMQWVKRYHHSIVSFY